MRRVSLGMAVALGLAVATLVLVTPRPAEAFIHEIIAAMCRAGGEEVIPPGQVRAGTQSFTRALLATGFISSVDVSPTLVVIHFDPTIPASKFKSAGFDFLVEDGIAPGVDLLLSPLVIPDENFAAHANCQNLNP